MMNALAVDAMTPLPPPKVPPAQSKPPRPPRFEQFIDLAALPTTLLCTRLFVASTLRRWEACFLEADAEQLAVELVRHSVKTCGVIDKDVRLAELEDVTVIRLRLLSFERTISIEVWDNATEPARLPAHPQKGELRGLGLDRWLEDIVKVNRRPETYAQCERVTRLYLKPRLGKFGLKQLSAPIVQGFLNDNLADGRSVPGLSQDHCE